MDGKKRAKLNERFALARYDTYYDWCLDVADNGYVPMLMPTPSGQMAWFIYDPTNEAHIWLSDDTAKTMKRIVAIAVTCEREFGELFD